MKLKKFAFIGINAAILAAALLLLVSAGGSDRGSAQGGQTGRKSISVTVYDRSDVPAAEGTIENNRWTRWINENSPVNVTFVAVSRSAPAEKLNVLFASGTAPDLVFEYSPTIKTPLYNQGMLMPLDDAVEKYSTVYKAFLAKNPGIRKAGLKPDGKMYELGRTNNATTQRTIYVRQDWLDKLNLKAPDTIEEMYQVAKAFAERDPDGNGLKDTYGIAVNATLQEVYQVAYLINHVLVNGDYVHNWAQLSAYYDFVKRLYDEGIIDRDYLSDSNGTKASQDFLNGKIGIYPSDMSGLNLQMYTTLKQNVPGVKIVLIPYPKTQFNRVNPSMSNPVQMTAVVNAACKDPESVMKYVDFISDSKAYMTLQWGIEGVHYRMVNGMPTRIQEKATEISYGTGDFLMLVPQTIKDPVTSRTMGFNLSVPLERELFDLRKSAYRNYDYSLPLASITHTEHLPQLPAELEIINANLNMREFFDRAVVSGTRYTVEMALRDARAAWERGGGNRIDDWFLNWYRTNRNTAFLYPDIYEIMKSQNLINFWAD